MAAEDIKEALKAAAIQIRDEKQAGANTALRVGSLLLAMIEAGVDIDELAMYFIRKDRDDKTSFKLSIGDKLTGEKGLQIGKSFVPGILTGSGGYFDEYANGEIESLIIRRFLEVPELRFNRVEVKLGDKWNAPGAGIIESVIPEYDAEGNLLMTGTAYLKLEEGEYGAIAAGDICMGIFHSEVANENAAEDSDDSRGNFQFAGFYTCYFTITEITGEDNKQFRYQLRPTSDRWKLTYHPSEAMTFVCYGSFTREDRQTSVYTTRTYTRLLKNQNTWEIGASNIAMQYGNMENMSIHGLDMTGYSMYLSNIYMTGTLNQIRPDGTPVNTANERGQWISGETYSYYDRVSHNGSLWLCVNESGTNTEPSVSDPSWFQEVKAGDSIKAGGSWNSANVPYPANSIVRFADKIWISNKETSEAPFGIFTDNGSNYLTYNDGGYILVDTLIQSEDWDLLIDVSDFVDGQDGKSLYIRYSSDKVNWHDTYTDGDIWLQQKVGEDGVWSDAIRFVGEDGEAKAGVYTDYQFAVNSSLTNAPLSGWAEVPPTVGEGQYLWLRVRVVDPNNNTATSWTTARIGGEKGDSMELIGRWSTGVTVPGLGVVTMGTASWSAKAATTNPPLWCWTDKDGNRLTFNDGGYILTGEENTDEYVKMVQDGAKGDTGATGATGPAGPQGKAGEQGIQGCIIRHSEWVSGTQYRNDEKLTDGTRYIDVALVADSSTATGWKAYKCKTTHTAGASNAPVNTTYWEEFAVNVTSIFTSLIIAKNASIKFLSGNQLLIMGSDGSSVNAGISGEGTTAASIRFWAGGTRTTNAPFYITHDGSLYATKANISGDSVFGGTLKAVKGTFSKLVCINDSGAEVGGISFGSDGRLWFSGDMYHQGYDSSMSRGYRFYASDIWCRGQFGARERTVLVVQGSYGYFYPGGLSGSGVYVTLESATSSLGEKYYKVPCYGTTGTYSGMPIDVVVFKVATTASYIYDLTMAESQRVLLVNVAAAYDRVVIYAHGNKHALYGGVVMEAVKLGSLAYPAQGTDILGRGLFMGAQYENQW